MAIVDGKVGDVGPVEEKLIFGFCHVDDYSDAIFVISPDQTCMRIHCKRLNRPVWLLRINGFIEIQKWILIFLRVK